MTQTLNFWGIGRTSDRKTYKVLPASAKRFLYDRMMEVTGFFIAIGVAAIAIALFSYAPNDPSLNNATAAEPTNPLGQTGAIAADLLIQIFGLAGYLPLIGFGIWGMRLITKRAVVAPFWRMLALLLAAIAAGVTLSALPNLSNWPLFNGMGGAVGSLVFSRSIAVLSTAGVSFAEFHLGISMAIIAIILWIFGIGMTRKEWGALAKTIGFGASALSSGMNKARTVVSNTSAWKRSGPFGPNVE